MMGRGGALHGRRELIWHLQSRLADVEDEASGGRAGRRKQGKVGDGELAL